MKKLLLTCLLLAGCQIGPNYYELENPNRPVREQPRAAPEGSLGNAYRASKEAALVIADLTDEELDNCRPYPGIGYSDSEWCGANPNEIETAKLHIIGGENGILYLYDDVSGEIVEFEVHKVEEVKSDKAC